MKWWNGKKPWLTGRMSQAGADRVGYVRSVAAVILAVGWAVSMVLRAIGGLWG